MKRIPLSQNKYALVDNIDYDHLKKWKWCCAKGYATRARSFDDGPGARVVYMAHVIAARMGLNKGTLQIEHADQTPLNNQRMNLRLATQGQNTQNRKKPRNNTSGFKGVTWVKRAEKWCARICHSGKVYALGHFDTAEEAAVAYDFNAQRLHGRFACTNGTRLPYVDRVGRRSDNTSGYRGVTWHKRLEQWTSRVYTNGESKHLGYFDTAKEAAAAYNTAALKYFGPQAYQNKL